MQKTAGNVLELMDTFLEKVRHEKAAGTQKAATDPSDPTTHPVMNKDDGTQKATTGARAAENAADAKKELGGTLSVGKQDDANNTPKEPSANMGVQQMASDEVKGNVPSHPKEHAPQPADSPSHPSTAQGEKYSSEYEAVLSTGNRIVEAIAKLGVKTAAKKAEEANPTASDGSPAGTMATNKTAPPAKTVKQKCDAGSGECKTAEEKQAAADKYKEDAQAGYFAASVLVNQIMQKEAADKEAAAKIEGIIKTAHDDARLFADYLAGCQEATQKSAAHAKKAEGEETGAPAGLPPEMLQGAGAPQDGGGMPMPPAAGAGAGGGGGDDEAIIQAVAQALAEAGISPEELAQAVQGAEGGAGGMPPGAGGGMPPGAGGGMPPPDAGGGMPPPTPGPEGAGGAGGVMPPAGEGSAEPSPKVKNESAKEETSGESNEEHENKESKDKEKKEEKKEAMAKYAALRGNLVKQIHKLVKSANKK